MNSEFEQKITAFNSVAYDHFGTDVVVFGDRLAVGAEDTDANGTSTGAVYLYSRATSTWTFDQLLVASDGQGGDHFGHSISLFDETRHWCLGGRGCLRIPKVVRHGHLRRRSRLLIRRVATNLVFMCS